MDYEKNNKIKVKNKQIMISFLQMTSSWMGGVIDNIFRNKITFQNYFGRLEHWA